MNIEDKALKLYPNPTKDLIKITNSDHNSIYSIYDVGGKLVSRGFMNYDGVIEVDGLSEGIYIINYLNEGILLSSNL